MRLTGPQVRALREVADGRVAQDRVARYYCDGERCRHQSTYRVVISHGLARHRRSAVARKGRFIPIDLTDSGRCELERRRP